jgi:hypothetical protein
MSHTPGPWNVVEGSTCYHVISKDEKFQTGCICFGDADPKGNAQLVAAAPDLLNAADQTLSDLLWLKKKMGKKANFEGSIKLLKFAVRKARGG